MDSTRHPVTVRILIVLTAIVVVLCVLEIGLHFYLSQPSEQVLVSFGTAQPGPLYGVDISSASTTAKLYNPAISGGSLILDSVKDATTTYYVFESADRNASNIYSESTKKPTVTPVLVTDSPTMKFGLSDNAAAHELAYVSNIISTSADVHTNADWNVTVLNTLTGVQKMIGKGTNPVILPGGIMVLVENGDSLSVINSVTGVSTNILSLAPNTAFAVTPDGQTLALYNPATKSINYFDISKVLSASYQKSQPAPFAPTAMTYTDGKLLLAGPVAGIPGKFELQYEGSSAALTKFTAPAGLVPQNIILP